MNKKILLPLLIIQLLLSVAHANCNYCLKAKELTENFLSKKIKCESLNTKTAEQQEQFVTDAIKVANQLINEAKFGPEQAKALLKLAAVVAPYDVAMLFPQSLEIGYRKGTIEKVANELEKTKQLDSKLKDQILEFLGLIPAKDRLLDIECPVK